MIMSLCTVPLFADITNRGRLDNAPSDFLTTLWVIIGIGLGGIIGFLFIYDILKNGFGKDKESNQMGCLSIILCLLGILFLVAMCSD